ncbi:MAG: TIGR03936 family radical SAM-associated protein [Clostridiales bacterium]|nr:TIGR03936 family radical SAM-associated protein [Clostridiales bacterium]
MKIRIKFSKEGDMKFIGHLDIMRYFQKVMRLADVDIRYSEGFSPHQIMSFANPLGVGMESRGEYVDIEVRSTDSSQEMMRRMNAVMVDGMSILSYRRLPDQAANAMSIVAAADYRVRFRDGYEPENFDSFVEWIPSFLDLASIYMIKRSKKGEKEVDIRPLIEDLHLEGHEFVMRLATGSAANLKPDIVMRAYMKEQGLVLPDFALAVMRTEVYGENKTKEGTEVIPLEAFGEDIE